MVKNLNKSKIPKITVLMSVYNGEKYLHKAIDSILNQTFEDLEFLIINDGSTDKTEEIINSFRDQRIRLISHKSNKGIVFSLNQGLTKAKGEFIARVDADDLYFPNRLTEQLNFIQKYDLDLVGCWVVAIDKDNRDFKTYHFINDNIFIKWRLLFKNYFIHSSVLFKKKTVLKIGGYRRKFSHAEDYDLWSRLFPFAKFGIVEKKLCQLRIHQQSLSRRFKKQQGKSAFLIAQKNIEVLLERKLNYYEKNLFKNFTFKKKFTGSKEILKTFELLQTIYLKFNKEKNLNNSSRKFIDKNYSYQLISLLKRNNLINKEILGQVYQKNKKFLLSPTLNLLLIKNALFKNN